MPTIQLNHLQCILNDEIDKDEVYLKYKGKKVWPHEIYKSVDNEEKKEIGITIEHENIDKPLIIELWDFDYLSLNDHLGDFTMKVDNKPGGPYSTSMVLYEKNSTASYILTWEIL
ncbi:MAG: hypothetical protein ACFHWX_08150 [Bacteroidota bacterium]